MILKEMSESKLIFFSIMIINLGLIDKEKVRANYSDKYESNIINEQFPYKLNLF